MPTVSADNIKSEMVADLYLYPSEKSGRYHPILPGYRCPVMVSNMPPWVGWDAQLSFDDPLAPGEARTVRFQFFSPEGIEAILKTGHFYLWEGRVIGEGRIVEN